MRDVSDFSYQVLKHVGMRPHVSLGLYGDFYLEKAHLLWDKCGKGDTGAPGSFTEEIPCTVSFNPSTS